MIGANAGAFAVRHERRKKKTEKSNRPSRLLLKPHVNKGGEPLSPLGSHAPSANPSRAGSPTHAHLDPEKISIGPERYGDECCYGKTSLLHFIVFFFLGGLTLLIVGVVQFKEEAGLHHARHHFLVAGSILIAIGFVLLVIKCACFRIPMIEVYSSETDEFLEKTNKNGSNNLNSAAATAANFTENHSSSPNKDNKHEENKNSASAIKTQDDEENRIDQAAASAIEASQKLNPV